jgi:hypothetical protein
MNAILKAVDFVSEAAAECAGRSRVAVPPVASGMASGEFRHLERRLSMIRQNENRGVGPAGRTLGRAALAAVCAGAVALLPLAPSLAQQEPHEQAEARAPRGIAVITTPQAVNTATAPRAELQLQSTSEAGTIDLRGPERVVVVQTTPEVSVGLPGEAPVAVNGASITFSGAPQADPQPGPQPEREHARSNVERARRDVQRLTAELEAARARLAAAEADSGRTLNLGEIKVRTGNGPTGIGTGGPFLRGEPQPVQSVRTGPGRDPQRRLDELERKLDRLLNEVQSLKDGRQGRGAPTPLQGPQAY